uniref:Uncharacterized protein n=1 Tax=Setaria viridis TaxID=4556 RepID=A0A4U6VGQ0_SETVI|nr:hypothetical protein SEVIR_3G269132v2 [Setaria viridis]TKW27624.1 hypothetical protein SEVIR_3G269132v2 [Setaria viridis]
MRVLRLLHRDSKKSGEREGGRCSWHTSLQFVLSTFNNSMGLPRPVSSISSPRMQNQSRANKLPFRPNTKLPAPFSSCLAADHRRLPWPALTRTSCLR